MHRDFTHEKFCISEAASIKEALEKISGNHIGMVFLTSDEGSVVAVATDGDIRKRILSGAEISESISTACNYDFVYCTEASSTEEVLKALDMRIKAVPILGGDGTLIDVVTIDVLLHGMERNIFARSRSPVRVSFAGGGSDLTHFFMSETGAVINATINLYCHASLRPRDDKVINISSADLSHAASFSSKDEFVDSPGMFTLFAALIGLISPKFGFDLEVHSDYPAGSGLGGSSAVLSAIIGCFNELRSDKWDDYEIAELAFQAERLIMDVSGGWQDQYASVFGGFNFIEFNKNKNLIQPLRLNPKRVLALQERLMLYRLDSGRNSGSIHEDQRAEMSKKSVNELVKQNVKHSFVMKELLLRGDLANFGAGLDTAWKFKKQFSDKISYPELDDLYAFALENGALGGKLLGAGGGGYFLFFVEPFKKNEFIKSMRGRGMEYTPFHFTSGGLESWIERL